MSMAIHKSLPCSQAMVNDPDPVITRLEVETNEGQPLPVLSEAVRSSPRALALNPPGLPWHHWECLDFLLAGRAHKPCMLAKAAFTPQ